VFTAAPWPLATKYYTAPLQFVCATLPATDTDMAALRATLGNDYQAVLLVSQANEVWRAACAGISS
jgi:hypothetical protein